MKVEIAVTIARILAGIKINKIPDKEQKRRLMSDYLVAKRIEDKVENDKKKLIEKFQEDWKEELPAVEKFRSENKEVVGHDEYLEAEKDAIAGLDGLYAVDSSLYGEKPEFEKVSADILYDADLWPEDILLAQIPGSVDFLIANGVAE